jgi:tRNA(Ile)-lysidine synthase
MKIKDGQLIRPLISTYKKDILDYLKKNNLDYCIDETNNSSAFLRNRIRQTIIPSLFSVDNRFHLSCMKTINQLQEAESFLSDITKQNIETVIKNNNLYLEEFNLLHLYLQKRIILEWLIQNNVCFIPSTSLLNEILRFLKSKKSQTHELTTLCTIKKKNNLVSIKKIKDN